MLEESSERRIRAVKERLKSIVSEKGLKEGLKFVPRSDDIIIAGYPKTGTTWMQQILHQLRTGGDEDFEDIYTIVPLLEGAFDIGQDLDAEQKTLPRCYKVHYWLCPKTSCGKYVIPLRHPYSVAYSQYKYTQHLGFMQPEELSLEEFIIGCWAKPRFDIFDATYFEFITSWWGYRDNLQVHFIFYEDLVDNREKELRRLAAFIGVHDESNIQAALEYSSFDYMKSHWEKFNSNPLKKSRICGSSQVGDTTVLQRGKIRSGSTTEGRENLPVEARKFIDFKWKEIVQPVTGFASYDELHSSGTLQCNRTP